MSDDPAALPASLSVLPSPAAEAPPVLPMQQRGDGTLVIDLMPPAASGKACLASESDPFNPEIIVCEQALRSPRITPNPLPEVDDFGNAIPRAQIRLSDTATAEANLINQGVGGFNANGGEVRLKIDF
jgi:hypothetical protein